MWDSIIDIITKVNSFLNDLVWGWPAIIAILFTGILLTIRTKCLQARYFKESFLTTIVPTIKSLGEKKSKDKINSISQFEAFSTAISGTVGTGNIIGVSTAIICGGPGAVFWMWVSAFFGMVTNYSENVLGLYYRKKDKNGNLSGGAFYYITYGIKLKWLGYIAAVFCVIAAIGMSGVQTNTISSTWSNALSSSFGIENSTLLKFIIGVAIAIFAGIIIIGGIKRIGRVAAMLVPFMSLLFIVLALIVIFINVTAIPSAFASIFKYAFNFKAAGSGIFGYGIMTVLRFGMKRGIFSNEAGLGSSVIAHSASETREPVKQGLWGVFEIFFDTFVICTLTALMFLVSFDLSSLTGIEEGAEFALKLFTDNFGDFGKICFCIILPLFAFTTSIAWSYYGEKATEFLFQGLKEKGQKIAVLIFKILFVLLIVASSVINSTLVWDISDTCNGLMALPNLIALIFLSGKVVKITKNYFDRKKGLNVKPMLSAYEDLNEEFKKDLKNSDQELH